MEYDRDKVDEVTLALLWLTSFREAGRQQQQPAEEVVRLALINAIRCKLCWRR
jgi:hypothetical protein